MSGTLASIIIVPYFCPMAQLANLRRIVIAGSKVLESASCSTACEPQNYQV